MTEQLLARSTHQNHLESFLNILTSQSCWEDVRNPPLLNIYPFVIMTLEQYFWADGAGGSLGSTRPLGATDGVS